MQNRTHRKRKQTKRGTTNRGALVARARTRGRSPTNRNEPERTICRKQEKRNEWRWIKYGAGGERGISNRVDRNKQKSFFFVGENVPIKTWESQSDPGATADLYCIYYYYFYYYPSPPTPPFCLTTCLLFWYFQESSENRSESGFISSFFLSWKTFCKKLTRKLHVLRSQSAGSVCSFFSCVCVCVCVCACAHAREGHFRAEGHWMWVEHNHIVFSTLFLALSRSSSACRRGGRWSNDDNEQKTTKQPADWPIDSLCRRMISFQNEADIHRWWSDWNEQTFCNIWSYTLRIMLKQPKASFCSLFGFYFYYLNEKTTPLKQLSW